MANFDNSNLYERVYLYVRDKILNNELKPGTKIVYEDLCKELGISRTPLRDAINRLKQDGLIEVKPRSGSYICLPDVKDIEDLYNVRKALECQAVEVAAQIISSEELDRLLKEADQAEKAIKQGDVNPFFYADRSFHQTIIAHSQNQLLINIMNTLELKIKWFGIIITKNFDRPLQANEMHKRILKAMSLRNSKEARDLMEKHIDEIKFFTMNEGMFGE